MAVPKNNTCSMCGGPCSSFKCWDCYTHGRSKLPPTATKVCGVEDCEEFGSSLDVRFGRLCSKHNQRMRRNLEAGLSEDEAYARIEATKQRDYIMPSDAPAELHLDKVKNRICEPIKPELLRPLLLFHGNLMEGRALSLYHLLASAKDAEVPTFGAIQKASAWLTDPVHYCGIHKALQRISLEGFCSRMWQSPTVLALESDWKEYLAWLIRNSRSQVWPYQRISETVYRSRREWRVIARPRALRKEVDRVTEFYPFIKGKPTDDHELILAVDALVPKGLLSDTRADICQDMIVSILTGEITLDELQGSTPKFIRQFLKQSPSKYGHLSLDAPLKSGEYRGKTLGETIAAQYR